MPINSSQLTRYVIRPTLKQVGLWSESAETLLLGTAAQESHLGTYLHQLGGGPAKGIYQMEPTTHDDIWENFLKYREQLGGALAAIAGCPGFIPPADTMIGNLYYATAMARVFYLRKPEPLPPAADIPAMARYWKTHYNTFLGRGTVGEFEENYRRFVKGAA